MGKLTEILGLARQRGEALGLPYAGALTATEAAQLLHLAPGAKLVEQKLADHFGVSRTLVRQALFQLAQNRLVRMEPARGAFVASPTVQEARQLFQVRRMLEAEMARTFCRETTPARLKALREHIAQENAAAQAGERRGQLHGLGRGNLRDRAAKQDAAQQFFLWQRRHRTEGGLGF